MALMLKVVIENRCVFKKWARWIVIGRYGYKSSFGANNHGGDGDGDDNGDDDDYDGDGDDDDDGGPTSIFPPCINPSSR